MAFTKADKQRIIDDYLVRSGRNLFVPGEFVDWLACEPEHEAYEWFFSKTDAEAARDHRIWMARQMANGLRITAEVSTAPKKGSVVSVSVREFPAYLSPVSLRGVGGGYQPFDPADGQAMAELRRQGAVAMRSWLNRYGGAFAGQDLRAMEKIAAMAEADRVAIAS
jgi:hypothetical protein